MRYKLYNWINRIGDTRYFIQDTVQKGTTPSALKIDQLFNNKKVISLMDYVNLLEDHFNPDSVPLCSFNNYDDFAQNNPELLL